MDLGDRKLEPLCLLGQGTFGRVFLCKTRKSNERVCVKRIMMPINQYKQRLKMNMIMDEIYIIAQLKHPRIVQYIRSYVHAGTINIVMEYVGFGTLRDVITRSQRFLLTEAALLRYFCDILQGLEYLHRRYIIHRDLKPDNLLLTADDRVKIADFGVAFVYTPERKQKQKLEAFGTPYYLAPEILTRGGGSGATVGFPSDIWSLGCVLYELCVGKNPFQQALNMPQLLFLIRALTRQSFTSTAIAERYGRMWSLLCAQMLVYAPKYRIKLDKIPLFDARITIPYYKQYFDYKY